MKTGKKVDSFFEASQLKLAKSDIEDYLLYQSLAPDMDYLEDKVHATASIVLKEKVNAPRVLHSLSPLKVEKVKKRILSIDNNYVVKRRATVKLLKSPHKISIEKQVDAFFLRQVPKEWCSLRRVKNGRIKISIPVYLRKVKNLIYIFKNKKTNTCLIGKTGMTFSKRISGYITEFNREGSENKVKRIMTKAFLVDVKTNPENFAVGILYKLKPKEDLDLCESLFIKHKKTLCHLYNENQGGGGGMCHSEEADGNYAIMHPKLTPFTPAKYYPIVRDSKGCIRPQLTPGFYAKVEEIREGLDESQEFLYVIKNLTNEMRYIGVTGVKNPLTRIMQHCYQAEYFDSTHKKYDPAYTGGALHPALAANPHEFGCGLMPIRSIAQISPKKRKNYLTLEKIAKVEKYAIATKQSLVTQNGYNCNGGGGGPIAKSASKLGKRSRL